MSNDRDKNDSLELVSKRVGSGKGDMGNKKYMEASEKKKVSK